MSDLEGFSDLVGDIYDTTLDQEQWPAVLQACCRFIGGEQASLFWHDAAASRGTLQYVVNQEPLYTQLYFEKYVTLNPVFPAGTFVAPGLVTAATDIVPVDEFRATRFYQEWLKPQGLMDAVASNLERSVTASALFAVVLSETRGVADAETRRRMALVVPHIRRAVSVGHLLAQSQAKAAALSEALGGLTAGVFLVDRTGRMVFRNEAGAQMLEEGALVRAARGGLAAVDPDVDQALQDTLARAAEGDAALGIRGVALQFPTVGDDRWFAHVLPLTSGARKEEGAHFAATAAVFIRRASLDAPSAVQVMSNVYGLTASEVKTLVAIVEMGGVGRAADAIGVSPATVKTHLQKLFAKTGTRRQPELVKLVASHAETAAEGGSRSGS